MDFDVPKQCENSIRCCITRFIISHIFPGGSTLYIESTLKCALHQKLSDDKPKPAGTMELTGHLGDVMKESAHIAYTFAKTHLSQSHPENKALLNGDVHVHVPEVRLFS